MCLHYSCPGGQELLDAMMKRFCFGDVKGKRWAALIDEQILAGRRLLLRTDHTAPAGGVFSLRFRGERPQAGSGLPACPPLCFGRGLRRGLHRGSPTWRPRSVPVISKGWPQGI